MTYVPAFRTQYVPAPDRYERGVYRRVGRSGLQLPEISLGLWQNFGENRPLATQREIVRHAFDHGVTQRRASAASSPPICGPSATRSSSRPRPATTCGRALMASGARASTCSPPSTSR